MIFYQKNEYIDPDTGEKAVLNLAYLTEHLTEIIKKNPNSLITILLVSTMVVFNWGAEVLKWKMLVSKILKVNYKLAVQSILGGVAASNMTPFRLGGFFARAAQLPFEYRIKSIAIIFLGDVAQFLCTIFLGSLSTMLLIYFHGQELSFFDTNTYSLLPIAVSIFFMSSAACITFLFINKFANELHRLPMLKNKKNTWAILNQFNYTKTAIKLLMISIGRLLSIAFQYYLAFHLFGFTLGLFESLLIINTLFLIYNFLPTFNIIEFGVTKSAILVFLLNTFISDHYVTINIALMVSCGSFLIWMMNLAIPSAIGSYFLFRIKLFNHK